MKQILSTFPTEIETYDTKTLRHHLKTEYKYIQQFDPDFAFSNYVDQFNLKIGKAMNNQSKQIQSKKERIMNQVFKLREQQRQIIQSIKTKQNLFQELYYKYLKNDIGKFQQYNNFFRKQFNYFKNRISESKQQKEKLKIMVDSLQHSLKKILSENRELQKKLFLNNNRSNQSTERISEATDISMRLQTEFKLERSKMKSLNDSVQFKSYQNRYVNSTQNLIKLRKHREQTENQLLLLKKLLQFRRKDKANKQWMWIQQVIYNQRIYVKLIAHIDYRLKIINTKG